MSGSIEEKLLQAIEKDDIKAFSTLMKKAHCGRYRMGRFPVLSLLYLYSSRAILSSYEKDFLKITSWEELSEPASVGNLFSAKAGKCLRLYLSEVVSPLEMLLILDEIKRLKKVFPLTNPSKAVKSRLQTVYRVKYALEIKFEGKEIILERRPLSASAKKKIVALCFGCFAAVAVAVATPVTCVSLLGKRSGGEVSRLSHIDFGARTTYTLKKNITIPKNYSVKEVNCTIIGGGNKIVLGKNATLGEFSGSMSDVEIVTAGGPIFTVCTANAVISNVTVNVNADVETKVDSAFAAVTNYGTFDGVTVNVGGKVSAVAGDAEELIFGGMVAANANTIKNCTVNYTDFSLKGEAVANATFGGIVGVNNGVVRECEVTGKITADTFDLAGASYVNYGELYGIVSSADLSQTSHDGWYPIVGGIAIDNVGILSYCRNAGNITVVGQEDAICGGIAARAYWSVAYCISSGDITVTAPTAYIGGIFGLSGVAVDFLNTYYFGYADHCIAEGKITVKLGEGMQYIGGIGGYIRDKLIDERDVYIGGSIVNCIFMGEIEGNFDSFGNIVGVCGVNLYEKNSYTSGNKEHPNFDGNYYIANGLPSFGAVESEEEEFTPVEGKGATPSIKEEIKNTELYKNISEKLAQSK